MVHIELGLFVALTVKLIFSSGRCSFSFGLLFFLSCGLSLRVALLARYVGFEEAGVHVELHLLGDAARVVDHLVLLEGLVAGVLPCRVLHIDLIPDLRHLANLLNQVVKIENQDHFAFSIAPLDELFR